MCIWQLVAALYIQREGDAVGFLFFALGINAKGYAGL